MAGMWQATLFLGVLTLILGIIVSFHPTGSLNVLAVLLGVLTIFSGIFHLIRVFDPEEAAPGLARHRRPAVHRHRRGPDPPPAPDPSVIGLVIGITWIVQGLAALIGGISGGAREGRAWWIIFGGGEPDRGDRRRVCPRLLA